MPRKIIEPKVEALLSGSREMRNSDKKLLLAYWANEGLHLTHEQKAIFMSCTNAESITRARRILRPQYPGDKDIEDGRYERYKEKTVEYSNSTVRVLA